MDPKDRVIFKLTPDGRDVIAFLPDNPVVNYGCIMSYEHVGQHGEASLPFYWDCKPARPEQYADLLRELESMGYRPTIRRRLNRNWITH